MNDGRTFDSNNTTSNIQGQPVYRGLFSIRQGVINVPCFSKLSGTYEVTATSTNQMAGIGWDGCEGATFTTTVRFEALHDEEVFNTGFYKIYTVNANGVELEDPSFGGYYTCYTGTQTDDTGASLPLGDVQLVDDCGALFFQGTSQWGELYSFNAVTVNGADLTLDWVNDYGEGASVRITRLDGTEWPTDLKDGD